MGVKSPAAGWCPEDESLTSRRRRALIGWRFSARNSDWITAARGVSPWRSGMVEAGAVKLVERDLAGNHVTLAIDLFATHAVVRKARAAGKRRLKLQRKRSRRGSRPRMPSKRMRYGQGCTNCATHCAGICCSSLNLLLVGQQGGGGVKQLPVGWDRVYIYHHCLLVCRCIIVSYVDPPPSLRGWLSFGVEL